jgi:hypothetical protein
VYWLLLLGFLLIHFAVYVGALRRNPVFRREIIILGYHAAAFLLTLGVALAARTQGALSFAAFAGLLALQLIYSMTLLEAWTLAQGSYSLQILLQVSQHPTWSRDEIVAATESIGFAKKRDRLRNLISLGLVEQTPNGLVRLRRGGDLLTSFLRAVMYLAKIERTG